MCTANVCVSGTTSNKKENPHMIDGWLDPNVLKGYGSHAPVTHLGGCGTRQTLSQRKELGESVMREPLLLLYKHLLKKTNVRCRSTKGCSSSNVPRTQGRKPAECSALHFSACTNTLKVGREQGHATHLPECTQSLVGAQNDSSQNFHL